MARPETDQVPYPRNVRMASLAPLGKHSRWSGAYRPRHAYPRSFMVKFCLAKAVECRRAAELATDPARRRFWLNTEGQWFFLARSYDNERRLPVNVGSSRAS
jgi:hypothetical protein